MKKLLPFILFYGIISASVAQQYWMMKAGSTAADEGTDICLDNYGNSYTTGYFSGIANFSNITLTSSGTLDIFLVKTNSAGDVQWAVKAGGTGPDKGLSVKTDLTGNCYITGFFFGAANFDDTTVFSTAGSQDVFLAKYDGSGNFLWVVTGGGKLGDMGNAVTSDRYGNAYITGQFTDTALFSGTTLISMLDTNLQSTFDAFIAKYDANGNLKWIKKGSAEFTDRGMDIGVDTLGNVYACGQFSDTITFGNTYNNNSFNATYLIKLDSTGNEIWFRRMGGSAQNITYGLVMDNAFNIYLTGDCAGNIIFFGPTNNNFTSPYNYNVFIAKYDKDGNFLWFTSDGSSSQVSARNIALDNTGNPHIIGNFRCVFSQYSDFYDEGTFNSIGFRDVFVAKYNTSGVKQWARQCGGQKDDFGAGIAVNAAGKVLMTGAYRHKMIFPGSYNFILNSYDGYSFAATSGSYCSDQNYDDYYFLDSIGNADIFIANAIDLSRQPYDYYKRTGSGCNRDFVGCCINNTGSGIYWGNDNTCSADTIDVCQWTTLVAASNTSSDSYYPVNWGSYAARRSPGPIYKYIWSTGDTTRNLYINTTGNYSVTITSIDSCFQSWDSIFVNVHPFPSKPTITDSKGININAINTTPIYVCAPDTVILTGGNVGTNSYEWDGPALGNGVDTISIMVTVSGTYTFYVENAFGCKTQNSVAVYFQPQIAPKLKLIDGVNDSIAICQGQHFRMMIFDTITNPGGNDSCMQPVITNWTVSPVIYHTAHCFAIERFYPTQPGYYQIFVTLIVQPCDTFYLKDTIYVDILPAIPVNITGNNLLCPGDSTVLTANSANGNMWIWEEVYGKPGIASDPTQANVTVLMEGIYRVTVTDSSTGCSGSDLFYLYEKAQPVIVKNPANGLICPGVQVNMTVNLNGISFQWYGPNGLITGATSQSYSDSIPGFYYCIVNDADSCELVSNMAEIKQYATPFLVVTPSNMICQGSTAMLEVITNDGSLLSWWAPLSGSQLIKTVNSPGTYTCSVTSCNITTVVSTEITTSNPLAQITINDTGLHCLGDSVLLFANPGMAGYEWSDNSNGQFIIVYQQGTYYLTTMDDYGCTASASFTVIFQPPVPAPAISTDTMACSGDSLVLTAFSSSTVEWYNQPVGGTILFSGSNYTTPALYQTASFYVQSFDSVCASERAEITVYIDPASVEPTVYFDSIVCEGDTIVAGTNVLSNVNYSWTGPNNFTSPQPSFSIYPASENDSGSYMLSLSSANCSSPVKIFSINVISVPAITSINSNSPICEGDSLFLSADSLENVTYSWTGPGNFASGLYNPVIPNVSLIDSGVYYLILESNGCTGKDTSILVDIDPSPKITGLSTNFPLCEGDTLFLIVDSVSGTDYHWTGPNNFDNDLQNPFISLISQYESGKYFLTLTSGNCSNEDSILVSVSNKPIIAGLGNNSPICSGDTLFLFTDSINGASYFWSGPGNYVSNNQNPVIENTSVNDSGTYFLEVNINGCKDDSLMLVDIDATPVLQAIVVNAPLCTGDTIVLLTDNIYNASYSWDGPSNFSSSVFNPVIAGVSAAHSGLYSVIASLESCRSESKEINVQVNPIPYLFLGNDTILCFGSTTLLNAGTDYIFYLWQDNSISYHYSASDSGIYYVEVTDTNGCKNADTINVSISDCAVPLPKIFTPNGDGINDYFRIEGIGLKGLQVIIFNRWGQKLFEWEGVEGYWDGKIQPGGEQAPEGVYFYVTRFTDFYDSEQKHNGYLHLIR